MPENISPLYTWKLEMAVKTAPRILLCGAKVWKGSQDPDHRKQAPNGVWTTTDIEAGDGVNFVADLQVIDRYPEYQNLFDGIYCPAVLEHIERPWVAIIAMAKTLASGGSLFIQTHQTFPHGYPHDYFRFSREALELMCQDAGLIVMNSSYDNPCSIVPPSECSVWNVLAESYLNVSICAKR